MARHKTSVYDAKFITQLRALRESLHLTQEQAAEKCKMPLGTYVNIEVSQTLTPASRRKIEAWMKKAA